MSDYQWTKTDRILYGAMVAAFIIGTVAMFIEACRSRPKQRVVFVVPTDKGKGLKQPAKAGPDES